MQVQVEVPRFVYAVWGETCPDRSIWTFIEHLTEQHDHLDTEQTGRLVARALPTLVGLRLAHLQPAF